MQNDDGIGFLAFVLGGVVVVVLTLALIAYRAQMDSTSLRRADIGPTLAWVANIPSKKQDISVPR